MKIGLFSIGVGPMADPETIALFARTADEAGFHSVWSGEHVVLFERYGSRYPYNDDGRVPVPAKMDFFDPFVSLTFAAAHSKRIRLGTGVCLLPERNPVVTAKVVASLDKISGGRFDFGIGIGWLEEEFAGVGVPWERRAARTREYVKAMRSLWTDDEAEFHGEFVSFPKLSMFPKPVQKPYPPVIVGGNTPAALRRAAEYGDGWFGVNVTPAESAVAISTIRDLTDAVGRDASQFRFIAHPGGDVDRDALARYRDAGVDEIIVRGVPRDPREIRPSLERLGESLVAPAARL